MKTNFFIFSIFLLLFTSTEILAQRRIVVNMESIFSFEPTSGYYSKNSLSPVVTYIKAFREDEPTTELLVVDSMSWGYRYYTSQIDTTLLLRVLEYLGAELFKGNDLDSVLKFNDLSDFPSSRDFEHYFASDIWAIKRLFATPIAKFDREVNYDAYGCGELQSLFHSFQSDIAGGVGISLFSPPNLRSKLPHELYIKDVVDLLYYNNDLVVVELTGGELRELLEKSYSQRYYQVTDSNCDMLNFRLPAFLHLGVSGVSFTLNLTKPRGRRVENWTLKNDEVYRVVMNSFLAREYKVVENLGDYKTLFIKWLKSAECYFSASELVRIEPKRFVDQIKLRENETIFGKSIY